MPHIRRTLLNILVLAAVVAALVVHPGNSSASTRYGGSEPAIPALAPPPSLPPDPSSGEPDSGSTRSQQARPQITRTHPAYNAQFAIRALRMVRWSSLVWMRRAIGAGE